MKHNNKTTRSELFDGSFFRRRGVTEEQYYFAKEGSESFDSFGNKKIFGCSREVPEW